MVHHPRLRRRTVHVGVGYPGILAQLLVRRRHGGGVVQAARVAHRPAVRLEVADVQVAAGADGALRVREIAGARLRHMAFPAEHDVVARRVHLPGSGRLQHRQQAARRHVRQALDPRRVQERGSQVHQVDEVVHGPPRRHAPWPARRQRHLAAQVVQVALAAREAGNAVVAAHHQQRVVQLADLLQLGEQDAEPGVDRLALAEVVAHVLAHVVHVGQERRQAAFQIVRLQAPELRAGAALPLAVGVGGAPPVTERTPRLARVQERLEVVARFVVQNLFGALDAALRRQLGGDKGEQPEACAGGGVARPVAAVGGVARRTRRPHLVGVADVIAGCLQRERVGGDRVVPFGALQDGAAPGLPEVAAGQDRAAARCAGRRRHERVAEQRTLARHPVEVGRVDDRVGGAVALNPAVSARVPAPVVREREHDVGSAVCHGCSASITEPGAAGTGRSHGRRGLAWPAWPGGGRGGSWWQFVAVGGRRRQLVSVGGRR